MKFISAIKEHKKINNVKKSTLLIFLSFFDKRIRYKVGIEIFLNNKLYDNKIDHSDFYNNWHVYIHKWKSCVKTYAKNKSGYWKFCHHIQYWLFKILYPGLDAMDYFRYEFYKIGHKKRKAFITEGFLKKMNKHFNPFNQETKRFYDLLDNKIKFNEYFKEYIKREWIASNDDADKFVKFCLENKTVFIKPSCGGGGSGVRKISISSKDEAIQLFNSIKDEQFIIEQAIVQNQLMSKLNNSSINTIRVYTVFYNNDIVVTGSTLRIGNGKSEIDNYSLGGYAAEIDVKTGVVISRAVNQYGDRVECHPVSHTQILGFKIPYWQDILDMVKSAAKKISELKYVGWDVALDENNMPQLIEGNTFAGVELQQHPSLVGKKYIYKKYW